MDRYLILRNDVFVVSFPKCGRTWLRALLSKIFEDNYGIKIDDITNLVLYSRVNKKIPKILFTHDDDPFNKKPQDLNSNKKKYNSKKVVFLIRDPRDVLVSSYFHKLKRDKSFSGTIKEYVNQDVGGYKTIIQYYNIWFDYIRTHQNVFVIKYRELHSNPLRVLSDLLNFLNIKDVTNEVINDAVEFASFNNMRKMEESGSIGSFRMKAGKIGDIESYKTRRGVVGGYVDYLDENDLNKINAYMLENLPPELTHAFE